MIVIEKAVNGEVSEIIEADNYVVSLNTKMDDRIINTISKMSKNLISRYAPSVDSRYGELLHFGQNNIPELLNYSTMYFVNSQNNPFEGMIPPCTPTEGFGVVGAVAIDYVAYAGSDTVRGTMNTAESNRSFYTNKYKAHVVVDFPTHACNGSFDTIYINAMHYYNGASGTPTLRGNRVCNSLVLPVVNSFGYTDAVATNIYVTNVYYLPDICVSSDNNTLYAYTAQHTSYQNVYVCHKSRCITIPFSKLGMSASSRIRNIRGKIYKMNIDTVNLAKNINVTELVIQELSDGGFDVILGDSYPLSSIIGVNPEVKCNVNTCINFGDFGFIRYNNTTCIFIDKLGNIVKDVTTEFSNFSYSSNYDDRPFCSYVENEDGSNCVYSILSHNFDRDFNLLSYNDMHRRDYVGYKIMTSNKRNFLINNHLRSLYSYADSYGNDGNAEIYELANHVKPPIKITLEEPVNKTNVETLKLIFDFDISIE